jgi:hypothetical protein
VTIELECFVPIWLVCVLAGLGYVLAGVPVGRAQYRQDQARHAQLYSALPPDPSYRISDAITTTLFWPLVLPFWFLAWVVSTGNVAKKH